MTDPLTAALALPEEARMQAVYQIFLMDGDMDFYDYLPDEYHEEFRQYLKSLIVGK